MQNKKFRKLASPYFIWIYIFALFPIVIMFALSFFKTEGLSVEGINFTFTNFTLLKEISTLIAFRNSILLALVSTMICIVIGYFMAYQVFKSKFKNKFMILLILILPMWSNLLLRIEALGNIMEPNNIITTMLRNININISISLKGTPIAIIIGMVFTYLPFMILPIYTALEKIDYEYEEAALDLGLTEINKFWKVIFPMSFKGIVSGSIMVFLPALSGFAIPEILGKGNVILIGNVIEQAFKNMNYNFGSLLAILILFFILGSLFLVNKFDKEGETLL